MKKSFPWTGLVLVALMFALSRHKDPTMRTAGAVLQAIFLRKK